ncbi:MAG: cupin domain-containing protein [Chitinivibrionales bacterium]|nr:cupin domain-containing protein [Chitinivibrionales bacterium]MBD3357778.1 cupin domain-containing protein [Chitinivibrionales bacterium]
MKTQAVEKTPLAPNPHGVEVRKLYDTEHAQTMHLTLKPGESLKRHITPVDVFFYVLEGSGIVEIGDERREITAHTLVDSTARIPHRWINGNKHDLKILVVKVPRPTESTKLL